MAPPARLQILQLYRGVGAMLVVLFHLTWYGGKPPFLAGVTEPLAAWVPGAVDGQPIPGFFLFGHSGVDLFIMLSGFVMVWGYGHHAGVRAQVWPYLRGRFLRIYPTYWAILAITVLYLALRPGTNDRALEPEILLRGLFLYGKSPTWQIPPVWTLPYEIALYGFFTLLLLAGWVAFGLGAALWCAAIVGTSYGGVRLGAHPILLSPLVLEFFLGCLGAIAVLRLRPRISGAWLAASVLACVAVGVIDGFGVVRGSHHDLLRFGPAYLALIVAGAGYELARERRYPRLLMVIGDASFSIYLTHYYLMHEMIRLSMRFPAVQERIGRDATRGLMFVLLIAFGVGVWALIERPLLRRLRPAGRGASSRPAT